MIAERTGDDVRIRPMPALGGTVRLPGSKSLTNRYLTCAALADGECTLTDVAICDDTDRMIAGLRALGIDVRLDSAARCITVAGQGGHLPADEAEIDAGAAGTAMRFLAALACLGYGEFRLDGSARMRARPIGELVDGLRALGAQVRYEEGDGYPPLTVLSHGLSGGRVQFAAPPSSQFVSALLMVAPCCTQDVFIDIAGRLNSRPYVDMTLAVMERMGVEFVVEETQRFIVPAPQRYQPGAYTIETDASAAAYFWTAAAITGGRVRVAGLTRRSPQGDARFVDVLAQMGAAVLEGPDFLEVQGPPTGRLRGVRVDLNEMPDTVQTLAVAALFAAGTTHIDNVANLRLKETDRLSALAAELTRLGARVTLRDDGLLIDPPSRLSPARIQTYNDHRMAMSFSLAGLVADGIVIGDAGCVSKSFPDFFDVLNTLQSSGEAGGS